MRLNTPDDPEFDACETDNAGGATCSNVFDEELERFGFAPSAAQATALYKPPFDATDPPAGAEHPRRPQPARPDVGRLR